ncbi:protein SPEAR1-like [Durio zibethinus]|uniref:Protein SPEAR1-like n=1 Tax=Durio zibethinus TaxID=66656 RepID=A0A6P5ZVC9_DURZI|nr:protein SPEAR1-like [Durio zibethinus]XP_022756455.1 protein SPEAR1-like [Durio zibethinus]
MDSSYFGEPNMGNERGGSSSSRKGKKSNSDKPKQPQRGLGVAQLEKIRLHGQMGCSYHPSLHGPYTGNFNQEDMRVQTAYPSVPSSSPSTSSASYGFQYPSMMMGLGEYDQRANIRYGDSQPSTTASWNPGSGILDCQHFAQPNMTRQLLNPHVEDSQTKKSKTHRSNSLGSSGQSSESSDTQELDLELRLSL